MVRTVLCLCRRCWLFRFRFRWNCRRGSSSQPTHEAYPIESRVVETIHGRSTGCFTPVIDKCAIALGDKKQALNVVGGFAGEVVFQIVDYRAGGQIANPQGMPGLFRFSWGSSWVSKSRLGNGKPALMA